MKKQAPPQPITCPRCHAQTFDDSPKCWQCRKPLPRKGGGCLMSIGKGVFAGFVLITLMAVLSPHIPERSTGKTADEQKIAEMEARAAREDAEIAKRAEELKRERENAELKPILQAAVQSAGFRCDSVDSAGRFMMSVGFKVYCNNFRYHYEIEDKGGHWIVTVK